MKGSGTSFGAISVMNAIPCGIGSTIGISLRTDVTIEDSDSQEVILVDRPNVRPALAETCVRRTREAIGQNVDDG